MSAKAPNVARTVLGGWRDSRVLATAILVAVLGAVLATYWPALSAGATYMDDKFYLGPPPMRDPSWASVKRIFGEMLHPSLVNGYYQPLAQLSVMLDFLDPRAATSLLPFHRTTLVLHLGNVALVVVLLQLLFRNWTVAGLLGLLWGIHPLNADAVLWIAERKTALSACFALGSMVAYVAYAQHAGRTGRRDWKRYGVSLLLYLCALLAKPTALPLLALLLVLDYWPLDRLGRAAWLEKIPFLVVASLAAVVAVISQARAGDVGDVQVMNFLYVPQVMGYCIGLYLFKTVWPVALLSDYTGPKSYGLTHPEWMVYVLGATVAVVAVVLSARRTRTWLAGGLFFVIAISPTLGIVRYTSSIAANRSMYFPMVGMLLPLAWGFGRLWNMNIGALRVPDVRMVLAGLVALLAIGSVRATRSYESHWRDSVVLLRYYLSQAPDDWKLHTRMGNEWIQRNEYPLAISEFREASRLNPHWGENHLNLGRALFTVGEYPEARQSFAMALERTPEDWRAHMLMGMTLSRLSDLEGALTEFRVAAQIAPRQAAAHYNVANTLARLGRLDEAAGAYRKTLQIEPRNVEALRELASIETKHP